MAEDVAAGEILESVECSLRFLTKGVRLLAVNEGVGKAMSPNLVPSGGDLAHQAWMTGSYVAQDEEGPAGIGVGEHGKEFAPSVFDSTFIAVPVTMWDLQALEPVFEVDGECVRLPGPGAAIDHGFKDHEKTACCEPKSYRDRPWHDCGAFRRARAVIIAFAFYRARSRLHADEAADLSGPVPGVSDA